jgi:hypothetical protein
VTGMASCHLPHEPVGARVQDEADLVGKSRPARRAITGKLCLAPLDQVLGLTARAIKRVIEISGIPIGETGDDKADVEPEGAGLDPRRCLVHDLAA